MTPRLVTCVLLPSVLLSATPMLRVPAADPYNPLWLYNARLVLFYDALCLPSSQRGVYTQQTSLHYLGHRYPLQQRYYNPQGLLDSCLTYELERTGDSLTSYLHIRAHYESRQRRDSLVSTVHERWTYYEPTTPAANRYVGHYTRYFAGNPPPTEPLLAPGARPIRAGTFRQGTQTDTATWRWGRDPTTNQFIFSYAAQAKHSREGYVSWQAIRNVAAHELTCSGGTNGGSWQYVRRYLNGGPDYVEHCHSSSAIAGTGGGSLASNVYTRTTFWQAGLCRREHFVAADVLVAGTYPEFDVVHTYAFHRGARRGR